MTPPMYLSRATLRENVPPGVTGTVLAPGGDGMRSLSGHHLVWTLFGDDPSRTRDFLWREDERGRFYLLSARPPEDRLGLFDVDPPREFAPALDPGDRLHFALRVNATVARRADEGPARGKPCDIVMDALHRAGTGAAARAATRQEVLHTVARAWLAARGVRHGFTLASASAGDVAAVESWEAETCDAFRVLAYRAMRIPRSNGAAPMRIGVLDLEGELLVDDPAALVSGMVRGFGRARAFGCGLMLVRRAR